MIIEGLVTTLSPDGEPHVAPMGPEAEPDWSRLTLRPFSTSKTHQNLRAHPEGVFHLIDDVELLARAAIGPTRPPLRPAQRVRGFVLLEACRYFEFRAEPFDEKAERAEIRCSVVAEGRLKEFGGFNRARHAVLEAAILATRAGFLPPDELRSRIEELSTPVKKTGGPRERAAFDLLREHVERIVSLRLRTGTHGSVPAAVRVRAASRLHFGLLAPAGGGGRRFGGVGAMVEAPGLEVVAVPAPEVSASGPLGERAREFARRASAASGGPRARIEVRRAPPEHVGLGTGTQLGMSVARALAELGGERTLDARELARRAGRGERSGVGLHGFLSGGLIVDGGKSSPSATAPLVARAEIPGEWRFVLLVPRGGSRREKVGLSGEAEREAFLHLDRSPALSEGMARAVLLGLLPALVERDLQAFGEALGEIQRRAGESFAAVQGGSYGSAELAAIAAAIQAEGVPGVGQSSWGPTLYAVVGGEEEAAYLRERLQARFPRMQMELVITPPANSGARVEPIPVPESEQP